MLTELLELLIPSVCPGCDRPRREGQPLLCAGCQRELEPLAELQGVPTVLAYRGRAARLVRRFKFDGRRDALAVLVPPLTARVEGLEIDGIVPVPRHRSRVAELGADPVYELARRLSAQLGLPLCHRVLRRSRPTPPQTGLSPAERRRNVLGSFEARERSLRARSVLLLDDVTTTGSTLAEAARVLREFTAARRVLPLALAGTPTLPIDGLPTL